MKRVCAIAFLAAAIMAMTTVSGCTMPFGGQSSPTPMPTSFEPIPSALPTPTPEPTPVNPAIAHTIPSNNISLITSPMDYKIVVGGRTNDGKQFENINLVVENRGIAEAKNVILYVNIINENNLVPLVIDQQFRVGDLNRGQRMQMNLTTVPHDYSNFIKLTVTAQWGPSNEYYLSVPYEHTFSNLVL
jgi:hypothetical protein